MNRSRMVDVVPTVFGYMLMKRPPMGDVHKLQTATDPEDRHVVGDSEAIQLDLQAITFWLERQHFSVPLLAVDLRINVGSTRE